MIHKFKHYLLDKSKQLKIIKLLKIILHYNKARRFPAFCMPRALSAYHRWTRCWVCVTCVLLVGWRWRIVPYLSLLASFVSYSADFFGSVSLLFLACCIRFCRLSGSSLLRSVWFAAGGRPVQPVQLVDS